MLLGFFGGVLGVLWVLFFGYVFFHVCVCVCTFTDVYFFKKKKRKK